MSLKRPSWTIGIVALLLILPAAVYLPGISGPWLFDDYPNLLNNSYVKIQSLKAETLYHAAYSLEAGPLQRPVAMLSFALNYYFSGSFSDTTPYKLTNILIHTINGLLLFWMLRLMFARLPQLGSDKAFSLDLGNRTVPLFAAAVTLLWLVHPIQLTSVLFVVQRMTELSAMFTLLGLIFYFKGRERMLSNQPYGMGWILFGLIVWGGLGIFSKENAVLLPIFILVMEFVLFPDRSPWRLWSRLSTKAKYILLTCILLTAVLLLLWAINYSLPYYASRRFTMAERVMTEARVLFFYISLILLPKINRFGHQHDDIEISSSLFEPWTTLPSILGLIALLALAIQFRRKQPLFSIGILWFFAGHLLESTIIWLEIAYEHRNYLPSMGILLVVISLLDRGCIKLKNRKPWLLVPAMAVVFGGTTFTRATQWSDFKSFSVYEALHHPNSPRSQANLSAFLDAQGHREEAMQAARRAWELRPSETGFLLNMHLLAAYHGKLLGSAEQSETLKNLATQPITPTTRMALQTIASCLDTECKVLQEPVEIWMNTVLTKRSDSINKSSYYYLLGITLVRQGRVHEAIDVLRQAYIDDPHFLLPLLALAKIFIDLKQVAVADRVIAELRLANQRTRHPRDKEISELAYNLAGLKKDILKKEEHN